MNERQDNGTVGIHGEEVTEVENLKCLGSTVQSNSAEEK